KPALRDGCGRRHSLGEREMPATARGVPIDAEGRLRARGALERQGVLRCGSTSRVEKKLRTPMRVERISRYEASVPAALEEPDVYGGHAAHSRHRHRSQYSDL